jgi:predicted HTH transcriptional regulator
MGIILILIVAVLVGLLALIFFSWLEAKNNGTATADEFVGICNVAFNRATSRQANIDKIIDLFNDKEELSNLEVRKVLSVSSRTAVRYLDELEKEGKVEQVGKVGKSVLYRLK